MKKMAFRFLCVALAFCLTLSVAACSQPAAPAAPSSAPAVSSAPAAPAPSAPPAQQGPTKIRIFNRVNAEVGFENNPVINAIAAATNTIIEYDAPPINNFAEKLTLLMASGDLPDLVYNWGMDANYEKWSEEGLFIPLNGLVEAYPNINKNVTKEMWQAATVPNTGKFHAVPRPNRVNHWGFVVNEAWLRKLNLKAPETIDDFRAVCDAFATKDPDGNGKADTFAFTTAGGTRGERYIASAFNWLTETGYPDTDGNFVIAEKRSGYVPYMTFLREAYSKKWMDQEFFTNKVYADTEAFKQNRVGFHQSHETGAGDNDGEKLLDASFNPPLKNANGERNNPYGPPTWGCWTITNACKNIPKALEFIDFGHSEEGAALYILGVKGVHYNSFDFATRALDRTIEQQKELAKWTSSYCSMSFAFGGDHLVPEVPVMPGATEKFLKEVANYKAVTKDVPLPVIKVPSMDKVGKDNPDMITKRTEMETKYVVGEIDEAAFKKFLETEYFPLYEAAEKDMQAAVAKALGK